MIEQRGWLYSAFSVFVGRILIKIVVSILSENNSFKAYQCWNGAAVNHVALNPQLLVYLDLSRLEKTAQCRG